MTALITPELVTLGTNCGPEPASVIHALATLVASAGRATDVEFLSRDALLSEEKTVTGVPGGITIRTAAQPPLPRPPLPWRG